MSNRCWKRGSSMAGPPLLRGAWHSLWLQALQVVMDRVGGAAAVGQGCDDEVGAVDVIAAGEDAAAAGAVVVADADQVAALVGVQSGGGLLQQVVGAVADGEDDGVGGDGELGAGDRLRAAAP